MPTYALTKKERETAYKALLRAIKMCGGVTFLAKELGISHTNVSNWLHRTKICGPTQAHKIEEITNRKVKKEKLRPDLYKKTKKKEGE